MAVTVASLQAVLDLDKRGFERGIKTTETMLNRLANVGIQKGINALESGFRAMGDAVVDSVRKSADLEAQLSAVGAVSGATADEIADIKELVKELGIDPNLKVSSFEAADAIEMLARNGLDLQDVIDGAARSTVLLANSTGGDFSLAADIATDSMSLFNIQAEKMDTAVNGIASVVTNSKFDINDYSLALAQAGGVAAEVGVDFDDFNTVIAGIAPLFASGSDAGTSFKTMLQRLVPSSEKAAKTMMDLGIIAEDGSNRFFDAAGNLKPMIEISGILAEAFDDLSEEQRNQALSTIFGTDAMRAAAGVARLGAEGFSELAAAMGETDAAEAAAMRMDNLAGSMEILGGVVETIKLDIGQGLNPVVREAADVTTDLLSRMREADSPVMRLGDAIENNLIGPMSDLAEATGAANSQLDTADVLFGSIGVTLDSFHGPLQAIGIGLGALGGIVGGIKDGLDYLDERFGSIGIKTNLFNDTLAVMLDHLLNSLIPFRNVTTAFQTGEQTLTLLDAAWRKLQDTMSEPIDLPEWLIPGSPTPLELGLRGIGEAINDLPDIGQTVMTPSAATSTNLTLNMGGQNFNFAGDDSNEQAIQMVVQILRSELSRA